MEWLRSLSLRKRVQWGVTTLLLFVVSTISAQWIVAYSTERGVFNDPVKRADALMGWLGALIGHTASIAALAALAGLAVGLWVDAFLASRERSVPPRAASPDIAVNDLIARIMKARGIEDDGSLEALDRIRQIGLEIGDQMSLRRLSVWARTNGLPLMPVPFELSQKGFGVGRRAKNGITVSMQYSDDERKNAWLTDYHFSESEISEIWPK